ncbi:MAG: beta-glucanase (GH16 family) [Rhodothermales bacterium]|jgi:beta-glucanase (GH16 family)
MIVRDFESGVFASLILFACLSAGCAQQQSEPAQSGTSSAIGSGLADLQYLAGRVDWAVNAGGGAYHGLDGVHYMADEAITGGRAGQMPVSKGAQDSTLYLSYRIGDFQVGKAVENGTYDVNFRFAEPFDIASGARVFTVFAEGEPVVLDLDVRHARDGKHISALDRVATAIEVTDGELNITFEASAGEPILSALVVRRQQVDTRTWEMVWNDEFDYEGAPDDARWSIDIWPARKVNDEDQTYTDRPENVRVENGNLVLEAFKETHAGAEYTSGRIHSQGKGDFLYGKVEARAKIPAGHGSWPAIWMLPTNPYTYATRCKENEDWQGSETCDAWPNSGEIDIMEHVGYDMNTVHGTVHNKAYYWINWEQRKGSIEGKTVDQEFHVYTLEWTPDYLTIFMDDSPYFTYVNEGTGWRPWPFDQPFHVILNLAVGGMWGRGGGQIDDSIFPMRMEVDYVRVYERSGES